MSRPLVPWVPLLAVLGASGCDSAVRPDDGGERRCASIEDCRSGERCAGGYCEAGSPGDAWVPADVPVLRVLTESARFVDVGRDRSEQRRVRLVNSGEASLVIERIEVLGASGRVRVSPDPVEFQLVVPPGVEYALTVHFTGSDGVAFTATLTLHSNDPATPRAAVPVVVQYTGRPQLVVTLDPGGQHAESVAAGAVDLGPVPAGLGRTMSLYLKNLGVGGMYAVLDPPVVTGDPGFTLQVAPAPDLDGRHRLGRFAAFCATARDCDLVGAGCDGGVCESAGLPADSLVLEVSADVAIGEEAAGELRIPYATPSGSAGEELRVQLTARGVPADLHVAPAAVAFGAVSVGFPQSCAVSVSNLTASPLTLERVELVGAGAAGPLAPLRATLLASELPVVLDPYDAVLARLDFVASLDRLGEAAATLQLETAERPALTVAVPVSGRARIGPHALTQPLAHVDAGVVHVGRTASGFVQLANGAGPAADGLMLLSATVSVAAGEGSLAVIPEAGAVAVDPGDSLLLRIDCVPTAVGELSGTLRLLTDAPDNPSRTLAVSCAGIDPRLEGHYQSRDRPGVVDVYLDQDHACRGDAGAYPGPCMDFGELYLGGAGRLAVTLANTGAGPLTVTAAELTPAGSAFELPAGDWPLVIPAGGESAIELEYQGDTTPALAQAALRLEHDDADAPAVQLLLVGSTTACEEGLRDCHETVSCVREQTREACCRSPADPAACLPGCTPCPSSSHTSRACQADACVYACLPGWVDLNGDGDGTGGEVADGCEYACLPSNGGVELCDGRDNDCDGVVDDGLALGDHGGVEAPQACTPASSAGFLGWFDETDLGELYPGSGGALVELRCFDGRVYVPADDPTGDVDWLRLVFVEVNGCEAVGFRLEAELAAPAGARLEVCGRLRDPGILAPYGLPCDESGGEPLFDACTVATAAAPGRLQFEWSEVCGAADDRVLDLRVSAVPLGLPEERYACEPYSLTLRGAGLY